VRRAVFHLSKEGTVAMTTDFADGLSLELRLPRAEPVVVPLTEQMVLRLMNTLVAGLIDQNRQLLTGGGEEGNVRSGPTVGREQDPGEERSGV
jgi:hypothetical protein